MVQLTRRVIPVLAVGVLLALPAGAQPNWDRQAELLDQSLDGDMTRGEMAALYPTLTDAQIDPPACAPGEEMFDDVPASNPFCPWIEELARRSLTSGCDANNYCPGASVNRAQMAAFIVQSLAAPQFIDRDGQSVTIPAGGTTFVTATCPSAETLVSGGGFWPEGAASNAPNLHIVHSFHNTGNTWGVRAYNGTSQPQPFRVVIVCRRP